MDRHFPSAAMFLATPTIASAPDPLENSGNSTSGKTSSINPKSCDSLGAYIFIIPLLLIPCSGILGMGIISESSSPSPSPSSGGRIVFCVYNI